MIGDWIGYLHPKKDHYYLKASLDELVEIDNGEGEKYYYIPLTEEILKANGFVDGLHSAGLGYEYKGGSGWFVVHVEADSILDEIVTKWCMHVHEVQHALRLCGFNDLADNFIVNGK